MLITKRPAGFWLDGYLNRKQTGKKTAPFRSRKLSCRANFLLVELVPLKGWLDVVLANHKVSEVFFGFAFRCEVTYQLIQIFQNSSLVLVFFEQLVQYAFLSQLELESLQEVQRNHLATA